MSVGIQETYRVQKVKEIYVEIETSEPLKIPLPKNGNNLRILKDSINVGSPTLISTNSSSFGESIAKNTERRLSINCDSPQIFSIESRTVEEEVDGGAERKVNTDKSDLRLDQNSMNFGSSSVATVSGEGASSGFNSDMDSEEESSQFYSSDIDSNSSTEPPLLWNFADFFSNIPGNDWCVRIPQCFIDDEFNLFELPDVFKCPLTLTDESDGNETVNDQWDEYTFDDLIDFITIEDLTEDPIPKISKEMLNDSILLYKLIHQRFIMTKSGLQAMWEKFEQQTYGTCPRYNCHEQPLLPLGPSALPGKEDVLAYCLNCQDIYVPGTSRHSKMDGVPFGPSFAHFFVRTLLYANETKAIENRKGPHDWQIFVPKIYGFRIFKESNSGIRNERPMDFK